MRAHHLKKTNVKRMCAVLYVFGLEIKRNGPCDEEDLGFPALVHGDKIEIKDGVSAIVLGKRGG